MPQQENKIQLSKVSSEHEPSSDVAIAFLGKRDDVKKEKKEVKKTKTVPFWKLFRFADAWDWLLMIIGTISGVIHGSALPVMFSIFGQLTTQFTNYGKYQACGLTYSSCSASNSTKLNESQWNETVQPVLDSFREVSIVFAYNFIVIGCIILITGSLQVSTWALSSIRQAKRLRSAYFRAIIRQNIGFHDVISAGELNARLISDVDKIKGGIGTKVSLTIQYLGLAISGLLVGFFTTWKLALATVSVLPMFAISSALNLKVTSVFMRRETAAYAKAGAIAADAISSIRTVVAFGCQHKEVDRFTSHLSEARSVGIMKGFWSGFSIGLQFLSVYLMYAVTFWYGITLVIVSEVDPGALMTTIFAILLGAYGLGTASTYFDAFPDAMVAGEKIFEMIDRVPEIDIFSDAGDEPDPNSGEIYFNKVVFTYPSRPSVEVLKGVTFAVEHGQTVALVGQTGCGKSTIIQLIQRFYDTDSGSILVGGNDVKDLKLRRHRELIGVVAQEPVLFATTIAENIRWGREGVTDREIEEAAKQANAYDFIMKLPDKFETLVGEGGGHMSGGQKQRIAIARAIARNPKILILDEATSALDTESESIVQAALEKASEGRTTIVIAHRLSTIRNADKIVAFHEGRIMEQGTHEELLNINDGVYANLIRMQAGREENKEENTQEQGVDFSQIKQHDDLDVSNDRMLREDHGSESSPMLKQKTSQLPQDKPLENDVLKGNEENDEKVEDLPDVSFSRILKMNRKEWPFMALGSFFAIIAGSADPISAILFADALTVLIKDDATEQYTLAMYYGLGFIGLGVASCLAFTIEATIFGKSGIELTIRLRQKAFKSMLRQEISYFDDHENSTGALCTRLATDASRVQGCTGIRLGLVLKNISTLAAAFVISFACGWKLTFLLIAFFPFIAIGGLIEYKVVSAESDGHSKIDEETGQITGEAIRNIRTIASLTKELSLHRHYVKMLSRSFLATLRKVLVLGVGYAYSQCVYAFAYAAAFRLGVELVITGEMSFESVFKIMTAIVFGAMAVGWNSSVVPDYAEAKVSASRMFALFDRVPSIDAYSDEGMKPDHCKGKLTLKSVHFTYPTRPDVSVLRGCDITVNPGQTLALVGQSGCGKSTTVQLLERFYDPQEGEVTLDGVDIRNLNIAWLRHQMGLVSQEPVLFDQSIIENIRYGDCTREASEAEVQEAAKNANIHDFISSLPKNYSTNVGAKGGQLSGGQKQRVAISRALLRNPKILLLDEATSALDTESERIVQDALDAAREGRTSIIIAHRLSTVRNADQIAVIDNGLVAEVGTHEELIARRGAYFSLVNAQLHEDERGC